MGDVAVRVVFITILPGMSAVPNRSSQISFHLIARLDDLLPADREQEKRELAAALDALRGEVGLTGLSVWAAAPPAVYLRSRNGQARCVHSEGGLYFDPPAKAGGCRPPAAGTASYSALVSIAQACERHGLTLRLRVAMATLGGLARYYPEFASRSAFDDPSRISVCLLNPAVQECVAGIVCAVPPQLGKGPIVLDDCQVAWFEALDGRTRWPMAPGDVERVVLSMCFCPSCVKVAQESGVDADEARGRVQSFVQRLLARGACFGGSLAGFLAEQPVLEAYAQAQSQSLGALLSRIIADARREVFITRGTTAGFDLDVNVPTGVVTKVSHPNGLTRDMRPGSRRWEVALPASVLVGPGSEEFVAAMSHLGDWGVAGVEIDDYGALPDSAFATLKQGIRFARRAAQA